MFCLVLGIEAIHVNGVEMVSRTRGWRKRLTKSRSPIEKLTRWLKRFAMNLNFWVVCYAFPKKGLQVVDKIALVMFMRGTFTANPICRDGSWIHPGLIPPNPMALKNLYLPSSPNQQPFDWSSETQATGLMLGWCPCSWASSQLCWGQVFVHT